MEVKSYWVDGDLYPITSKDRQKHDVVLASDFDRVTAERDTLNARLTAADEHNDRLISAINKVRSTVCLPASIEAILISALDRKEKN